ncbi:hypothetical protein WDV85_07925 [Pseudokineococcus sp. 5B2Z-1]|uniref:hypothetical protein n=1 Tax=Pseudokineococcus sp. 5B2Z-1 TaxID=3132744 RepID=UPI0030A0C3A5
MELHRVMQRLGLAERPGGPPPLPQRVALTYLGVVLAATGLMFLGVLLSFAAVSAAVYVSLYLLGAAVLVVNVIWMRRYRRSRAPK